MSPPPQMTTASGSYANSLVLPVTWSHHPQGRQRKSVH